MDTQGSPGSFISHHLQFGMLMQMATESRMYDRYVFKAIFYFLLARGAIVWSVRLLKRFRWNQLSLP